MSPAEPSASASPTVYLNGRFVPEEEAAVSVFDRGFLYGDGLFETVRALRGRLFLWDEHAARLTRGARQAAIPLALPPAELGAIATDLLARNGLRDAIVRIHLTRGRGPRGYSPHGAGPTTLVVTTHPAPPWESDPAGAWRVHTAQIRVPAGDSWSGLKGASRLPHVLARAEADAAGADEALLLNHRGRLAELSAANLFWFEGDVLCTPSLAEGALAGITRDFLLRLQASRGRPSREVSALPTALTRAHGVFGTQSSRGLVEITGLDGRSLGASEQVAGLQAAYRAAVGAWLSD